jgi:hypothetical protein
MSSDDKENMLDSEACPSDDTRNDQNATDKEVTPSQYNRTLRDNDDNAEKANESEG